MNSISLSITYENAIAHKYVDRNKNNKMRPQVIFHFDDIFLVVQFNSANIKIRLQWKTIC